MQFRAKIKTAATVHKEWRASGRIGGDLLGIRFHWVYGAGYVSDELNGDQVAALRESPIVVLEAIGARPPEVPIPAAEKEPSPEDLAAFEAELTRSTSSRKAGRRGY